MKKEWKKEDIDCKHIRFSNKEEENKLIEFLTSLGLKEKFAKDRTENDNCFYISGSSDYYFTDNQKNTEFKYSDIFPEESFKQEQQFIVGKWYKDEENKFYAKCLKFEYNRMFCNNHILTPTYYNITNYTFQTGYKWELLTNLQEIQSFLPKGHEDLINTAPKEESFAILLNSQEELDECIKWAENKGYIEHCDSNSTFSPGRHFVIRDDEDGKPLKWYSVRDPMHVKNRKTLSDIGIIMNKEEIMFKKDDYIIPFKHSGGGIYDNYCFKQREACNHLRPYIDCYNSSNNGHYGIKINNNSNWRYATKEEIAEYNRIGKPFNVNTLNSKEQPLSPIKEEKWIPQKDEWCIAQANTRDKEELCIFENTLNSGNHSCLFISSDNYTYTQFLITKDSKIRKALPHEIPVTPKECISSSNSTGIDPYMNETIELGDYIKIIKADVVDESNNIYGIVTKLNAHDRYPILVKTENYSNYSVIYCSKVQIIKKSSQIQQNNGKKVDEQLPNIAQNYEILDIFKPKLPKTMDFTSFQQQSPKELGKISKNKHLTI